MRKKSIIRRLLPWLITAALLAALIIFVFVPIYSQNDTSEAQTPEIRKHSGEKDHLILENDTLLFDLNPENTAFTVTDKQTGKIWYSTPQDAASDSIALTSNKDALSSTILVTYTTDTGEVTINNYEKSIVNQTYQISQPDDKTIRVDYSIGDIEKETIIPTAITKERYTEFLGKMKTAAKSMVKSCYTLVEPAKLEKAENKDELITLYPSVTEQPLYILKADIKPSNKEKMEKYFADAGYTMEDYEADNELLTAKKTKHGPVFNISMIYTLGERELLVEVPYSEVSYDARYPITYLTPLPMFGAAGTAQEGYILVPEGSGAIIRYNNGKLSQNPYYANMYGWDYGMERLEAANETRIAYPVFGMGQADGSFLCVMDSAESYAGINADIAGRLNSYNTVNAKYRVLHYDQYHVSAETSQSVFMYEKQIPNDTIRHRYRFVDGDSYADLAGTFRSYLTEKYPELKQKTASEQMPVNVELIGAIDKILVKAGLPVDSVVPITTFRQAGAIINELLESSVSGLNVRLTGWCNGGVRQKVLTGIHVLNELGGEKELKSLISDTTTGNIPLYLDGITCFAYDSGITDGFSVFSDAARYTTRETVKLQSFDIVTAKLNEQSDEYYLTKPSYARKNASRLISYLKDHHAAGIAFRDIGLLLSADYYARDLFTREQVKELNIETLKEAAAAGQRISIKGGNTYALPYADLITDMDLAGYNYAILDEQIPFYPMAIHGLKDFTGKAINLEGDYQTELLRCAGSGAGLQFSFMNEDTSILLDTDYSRYSAAGFTPWKKQATEIITRYQTEMKGLNRQTIIDFIRINDHVTVTVFEDGTKVFVNYGNREYQEGSVRVPARDYLVERGRTE